MKLAEKVSVITGAAAGQGQAAAVLFAREGSSVVAADIDVDGLNRTEALVREADGDILTVRCDVSKSADVLAPWSGEQRTPMAAFTCCTTTLACCTPSTAT